MSVDSDVEALLGVEDPLVDRINQAYANGEDTVYVQTEGREIDVDRAAREYL